MILFKIKQILDIKIKDIQLIFQQTLQKMKIFQKIMNMIKLLNIISNIEKKIH